MVSGIHTKQSFNEENSSLFMTAFYKKVKLKIETSSLRNLKIMPRNLKEIVLSGIPSRCVLDMLLGSHLLPHILLN